jgi:hypothetical protein
MYALFLVSIIDPNALPIQVTVQTGAVTAVCATVDLIVYLVDNTGT